MEYTAVQYATWSMNTALWSMVVIKRSGSAKSQRRYNQNILAHKTSPYYEKQRDSPSNTFWTLVLVNYINIQPNLETHPVWHGVTPQLPRFTSSTCVLKINRWKATVVSSTYEESTIALNNKVPKRQHTTVIDAIETPFWSRDVYTRYIFKNQSRPRHQLWNGPIAW